MMSELQEVDQLHGCKRVKRRRREDVTKIPDGFAGMGI